MITNKRFTVTYTLLIIVTLRQRNGKQPLFEPQIFIRISFLKFCPFLSCQLALPFIIIRSSNFNFVFIYTFFDSLDGNLLSFSNPLNLIDFFLERDLCKPNPCQFGNKCHQTGVDSYQCVKNLCNPSPCMHDGRCIEINEEDYLCACKPGYTGKNCNGKYHQSNNDA